MLRYVAIGDSLSEGIGDDPWPDGTPRGWTTGTVFEDPRAWAPDRLHLSALGHDRLARAAAATFGVPAGDNTRTADFLAVPDGPVPAKSVRAEASWWWTHVAPWVGRRLRGRSSADGRAAKRPDLIRVDYPA